MDETPASNTNADLRYREKRTVPRYTFIASVTLTESTTQARMSCRISEISRKGCYVDILNTLPVGTMIDLVISRDQGTLCVTGRIIYVQEGMGMGVAFTELAGDQAKILDQWLAEIST